ncbi:CAP domain-containing protein [Mycobacterium intracellulare]|uniref:CAP domain-containing protein n=1 Tax=Mycobacterium intracellulare TaxID=1767 RepID=UPI00080B656E|nr:CAP domain-containing protein [Mycobacterium intracellulare]OCB22472.1 hypothetical protein A5689_17690 [Mycobacterium intracellulare subsp. yongonense]
MLTSITRVRLPAAAIAILTLPTVAITVSAPSAHADNRRLNSSVIMNVYTIQHQAGCSTNIVDNPKLRLAAQWHTNDVLNNRALDGDIGSDGTTVADRARNAGYTGAVAETVAINPAISINGMDILNLWYYRPDYLSIMQDCRNVDIGVWSENSFDRSVVVAVYGRGEARD